MVSTRRNNLVPFLISFPPFARGMKKVNEKKERKNQIGKKKMEGGVFCVNDLVFLLNYFRWN